MKRFGSSAGGRVLRDTFGTRQRDTNKRYLEPLEHLHHKALVKKNVNDKQIGEYFRSFSESEEVSGPCENIVVKCKTTSRAYAEV